MISVERLMYNYICLPSRQRRARDHVLGMFTAAYVANCCKPVRFPTSTRIQLKLSKLGLKKPLHCNDCGHRHWRCQQAECSTRYCAIVRCAWSFKLTGSWLLVDAHQLAANFGTSAFNLHHYIEKILFGMLLHEASVRMSRPWHAYRESRALLQYITEGHWPEHNHCVM